MRVYKFLECFNLNTKVMIYDKESQALLYQGCIADVPLKVCSQRNIIPNSSEVYENILNITIC